MCMVQETKRQYEENLGLRLVLQMGQVDIAHMLIERSVGLTAQDDVRTPLHLAWRIASPRGSR